MAPGIAALARSVPVTGSNRGIGLELVRQLAASPRPPQHIFATCRDPGGPRRKVSEADTVNLPSIHGAVRALGSHLKDQGLNLPINNAGVSSHTMLHSLDSQEMLSVFSTNAIGPLQVARGFLPLLEKAAKGSGQEGLSCSRAAIINVSTKLGSIGLCVGVHQAPMYPYRASEAAQNMVTRCLAVELQDRGILCTAIHPGWVKTNMGTEKKQP
ncbi:C-signal-like [Pezoporus occidentalis]|uniref:C-signal-like n=1 Tax=Pezoporus occidentalis TaxID=407982 RepID=UPI002F9131FB